MNEDLIRKVANAELNRMAASETWPDELVTFAREVADDPERRRIMMRYMAQGIWAASGVLGLRGDYHLLTRLREESAAPCPEDQEIFDLISSSPATLTNDDFATNLLASDDGSDAVVLSLVYVLMYLLRWVHRYLQEIHAQGLVQPA